MQAAFWHDRWQTNQIGFHQGEANQFLVKNLERLQLAKGSRILLPLCGKSIDLHWLLGQGYQVVGVELSPMAIDQLFTELNLTPTVQEIGSLTHYQADNIDVFVGDVFDVNSKILGHIDAVYDRAALVALPDDMRLRYTQHLQRVTNGADQLLIGIVYDQSEMQGPPFSVDAPMINTYYSQAYHLILLETVQMLDGLKGKYAANEQVWLLNAHEQHNDK